MMFQDIRSFEQISVLVVTSITNNDMLLFNRHTVVVVVVVVVVSVVVGVVVKPVLVSRYCLCFGQAILYWPKIVHRRVYVLNAFCME